MTTPTTTWHTAVRMTTVAALTAGVLIVSGASVQAVGAPVPGPDADLLGSLMTQVGDTLSGILSGGAVNTILPNGVLGG